MALVIFACLSGGWTIQSCDENFNDPAAQFAGCGEDFCVAAGERCKYGLKSIRHRYLAGLATGPAEIYFGGSRTNWCWKGGSITKRRTNPVEGWTSSVGSGSVNHSVYSSNCSAGNASCLVRLDFLARLEATVPGFGLPVAVNERFCTGVRVYAGGAHTRSITGGSCPGAATAAKASVTSLTGVPEGAVDPALEQRIGRLAWSRANLRSMATEQGPLPELKQLLVRAYRQLPPATQRDLRPRWCIARLGSVCEGGR